MRKKRVVIQHAGHVLVEYHECGDCGCLIRAQAMSEHECRKWF